MSSPVEPPKATPDPGMDTARRTAVVSGILGLLLTLAGVAEKFSNLNYWIVSNVLIYVGIPLILLFLLGGVMRLPSLGGWARIVCDFNNKHIQPIAPLLTLLAIVASAILISVKIDLLNVPETQYADEFPQNLKLLNDLIGKTKRELLIGTDFAAYGGYSLPGEALKYRQNLESARQRGVSVRMIVYSDAMLDSWVKAWFGDDDKRREKFDDKNWGEFTKHNASFTLRPQTLPEVQAFFKELNRDFVRSLDRIKGNSCETRGIDEPLALFFWVRDKEEAIFSFSCERPVVLLGEVSFRTTDPKIIEALVGTYVRTSKLGRPIDGRPAPPG